MAAPQPPEAGAGLQAIWHDAHGDWERAHSVVQQTPAVDPAGSWVHAYLHRKEGDLANARYWYTRAGKTPPDSATSLDAEREAIARELLQG